MTCLSGVHEERRRSRRRQRRGDLPRDVTTRPPAAPIKRTASANGACMPSASAAESAARPARSVSTVRRAEAAGSVSDAATDVFAVKGMAGLTFAACVAGLPYSARAATRATKR